MKVIVIELREGASREALQDLTRVLESHRVQEGGIPVEVSVGPRRVRLAGRVMPDRFLLARMTDWGKVSVSDDGRPAAGADE